jgi:hypothetical protein
MGDTSSEEITATFDQIDEFARALFHKADATGIWAAQDEMTRLYWRKEAVRRLQQARYKEMAERT